MDGPEHAYLPEPLARQGRAGRGVPGTLGSVQPTEVDRIAGALGGAVIATRTLAGGFSHETSLVTLADGQVVARLGGSDPAIEAAVMAAARPHVPVPEVLLVMPPADGMRQGMILEHVAGTPLSEVLAESEFSEAELADLGAEVGQAIGKIAAVAFDRPGFFADGRLIVRAEIPWSEQLPGFAASCVGPAARARLDASTLRAWVELCTAHAPALASIDDQARLVHADVNPKNILVSRTPGGWSVDSVLDWEFSFSSCPYSDAANMARFGDTYPQGFLAGFLTAFAVSQPADCPPPGDWLYLGRVMDMFALSDLVTREAGHAVADQAAEQVRRWVAEGVPSSV
jgi:aminoglycoside phosphotransferase (APT) family kinase protein